MTSTFYAKFTRYRGHERRLSGHVHFNVEDFPAAYAHCNALLAGMRSADPDSQYDLVALGCDGYRGVDCSGGVHMFETGEEAEARLSDTVPA